MTRLVRAAAPLCVALALAQAALVRGQAPCLPAVVAPPEPGFKLLPIHEGLDLRTGFGDAPRRGARLELRNTTTGAVVTLPWSLWEFDAIHVPVPYTVPNGTYDVRLWNYVDSTHRGYVFPACVSVNRPDTHGLIRAPVGVLRPTLTRVQTPDQVCARDATIRLTGAGFAPGTEQPAVGSWRGEPTAFEPMARRWRAGTTMVELGADDPRDADFYTAWIQGLRIYNPTTMELTIQICFLLEHGAKARIWFPDGSQSPWVPVTLADASYYRYRP